MPSRTSYSSGYRTTTTDSNQSRAHPCTEQNFTLPLPEAGTFGAGRSRGDLWNRSRAQTHAPSRAELESSRVRSLYTAGPEFSPPTVLRTGALASKWKRYLAAYASLRSTTRRLPKPPKPWSIAQTTGADHCHSTGTIHHPAPNFQTLRYHRPIQHASMYTSSNAKRHGPRAMISFTKHLSHQRHAGLPYSHSGTAFAPRTAVIPHKPRVLDWSTTCSPQTPRRAPATATRQESRTMFWETDSSVFDQRRRPFLALRETSLFDFIQPAAQIWNSITYTLQEKPNPFAFSMPNVGQSIRIPTTSTKPLKCVCSMARSLGANILAAVASTLFANFLSRVSLPAVLLLCLFIAPTARAVEPTTVLAINAAVSTFQTLIASSTPNTPDTVSRQYFEQILKNQERISQQLTEITSQITTIAKLVDSIPKRVVSLDKEVTAKSIYESVMRLHLSILEELQDESTNFDSTDERRLEWYLQQLEKSASDHLAFIKTAGWTFDAIVAVRTIQIALQTLIDSARITGFTNAGNRRYLRDSLILMTQTANEIQHGLDTANVASFGTEKRNTNGRVNHSIKMLASFKEDRYFRIGASEQFYVTYFPSVLHEGDAANFEYTSYYICTDINDSIHTFYGDNEPDDPYIEDCRYYPDGERTEHEVVVKKVKLRSIDSNETHFSLKVEPAPRSREFSRYVEDFNKAKSEYLLYTSATFFLDAIVNKFDELNETIEGL